MCSDCTTSKTRRTPSDVTSPRFSTTDQCVHVLRRVGEDLRAWPLDTESFGESVSRLAAEVFHLDVRQTGYHQVLSGLLGQQGGSSDSVLGALDGQLGSEGRFVLRALEHEFGSGIA